MCCRIFVVALTLFVVLQGTACVAQQDVAPQTEAEATKSLESFRKLDDHPLFEMHFFGDYVADKPVSVSSVLPDQKPVEWACSIFVSYGKDGEAIYGRNFDWMHNPALVLHTHPPDGYASVSMVDISYLGFTRNDKKFDSIEGRRALLKAPLLPFDGMNEHGLTIGMAAVQETEVPDDPDKPDVGSLQIIRMMLDGAKNTEEALALFDRYDIRSSGGPKIHYLIADAQGESALIELKDGKKHVQQNPSQRWQAATNFYMAGQKEPTKQCARFAKISERLKKPEELDSKSAFRLLKDVSQRNTRWSNVYDMKNKSLLVCTSRNFEKSHAFQIDIAKSKASE